MIAAVRARPLASPHAPTRVPPSAGPIACAGSCPGACTCAVPRVATKASASTALQSPPMTPPRAPVPTGPTAVTSACPRVAAIACLIAGTPAAKRAGTRAWPGASIREPHEAGLLVDARARLYPCSHRSTDARSTAGAHAALLSCERACGCRYKWGSARAPQCAGGLTRMRPSTQTCRQKRVHAVAHAGTCARPQACVATRGQALTPRQVDAYRPTSRRAGERPGRYADMSACPEACTGVSMPKAASPVRRCADRWTEAGAATGSARPALDNPGDHRSE